MSTFLHYSRIGFCLLIITILSGFTQDKPVQDKVISPKSLIGIWQVEMPLVGAGMGKAYYFYKNGNYTLSYGGYNPMGAILSSSGKWKIEGNRLAITVTSWKEIVGGQLVPGSPGVDTEEFQLSGGKIVTIKQKGSDTAYLTIERCTSKIRKEYPYKEYKSLCVSISHRAYFKLSADPFDKQYQEL